MNRKITINKKSIISLLMIFIFNFPIITSANITMKDLFSIKGFNLDIQLKNSNSANAQATKKIVSFAYTHPSWIDGAGIVWVNSATGQFWIQNTGKKLQPNAFLTIKANYNDGSNETKQIFLSPASNFLQPFLASAWSGTTKLSLSGATTIPRYPTPHCKNKTTPAGNIGYLASGQTTIGVSFNDESSSLCGPLNLGAASAVGQNTNPQICSQNQKLCNNACVNGNCCSDTDCSNGETCVSNVCTAPTKNFSCNKYASEVVSNSPAVSGSGVQLNPSFTLGAPDSKFDTDNHHFAPDFDNDGMSFGYVTVKFIGMIIDGAGNDVRVHLFGFEKSQDFEKFDIFGSADGVSFTKIGEAIPTQAVDLLRDTRDFDLMGSGLATVQYIKIQNKTSTAVNLSGPDIDALEALNYECPQCTDGKDNDNDGKIDHPNDAECSLPSSNSETNCTPQNGMLVKEVSLNSNVDVIASGVDSLGMVHHASVNKPINVTVPVGEVTVAYKSGAWNAYGQTPTGAPSDPWLNQSFISFMQSGQTMSLLVGTGASYTTAQAAQQGAQGTSTSFTTDTNSIDVYIGDSVLLNSDAPTPIGQVTVQIFSCAAQTTQCSDMIDNDNDGKTDHPNDSGCTDANDNDESNVVVPMCGNGTVEGSEACDDGNKNNGDSCSSNCEKESCATNSDGVFLLHFDEKNPEFIDSGTGEHALQSNNVQLNTNSKKFGAGSGVFNGSDSYIDITDFDKITANFNHTATGATDFTFEFWVNLNSLSKVSPIYDGASDNNNHNSLFFDPSKGWVFSDTKGALGQNFLTQGSVTLMTNTFTHVAFVRKGTTYSIFENGKKVISKDSSSFISSANVFRIGKSGNLNAVLDGALDEMRLITGTALYSSDFTPPSGPTGVCSVPRNVAFIKDTKSAPVLISLDPPSSLTSGGIEVTGDVFIDPDTFDLSMVEICFGNANTDNYKCASSVSVSNDGMILMATIPAHTEGFKDVKLKADVKQNVIPPLSDTSVYENFFEYIAGTKIIIDETPPIIEIANPEENAYVGKNVNFNFTVDGTGSNVEEVLIKNTVIDKKFFKDIDKHKIRINEVFEFASEGQQALTITAKDASNNVSQKSIILNFDFTNPTITGTLSKNSDGTYKFTGNADGTGSPIESIMAIGKANAQITFEKKEKTSVVIDGIENPQQIKVIDKAGNEMIGEVKADDVKSQCSDGKDNDGDGKVDLNDPGCENKDDNDETDEAAKKQCDDGKDNDGDDKIDLNDPGCENKDDNDETDEAAKKQCDDGKDNDGDDKVDLNDPGCENKDDNDETDAAAKQCGDGIDNDNDGKVDLNDPGCENKDDNDETNEAAKKQCDDGKDNDGDEKVDLDDPGCENKDDNDETNAAAKQCGDGIDNDNDGKVDLSDLGCKDNDDNDESDDPKGPPQCNDGKDNDNDGRIDHSNDKGCESKDDDTEFGEPADPNDTTAPEVNILSPENNSLSNKGNVLVKFVISDEGGIKVSDGIFVNGEKIVLDTNILDGAMSITISTFVTVNADGDFKIEVKASDLNGNQGSDSVTQKVDRVVPSSNLSSETSGNTTSVSGSAGGTGSEIVSIRVTDSNGNTTNVLFTPVNGSNENVSFNTVVNGTSNIVFEITDAAGNTITQTIDNAIVQDAIPPEVVAVYPTQGQVIEFDSESESTTSAITRNRISNRVLFKVRDKGRSGINLGSIRINKDGKSTTATTDKIVKSSGSTGTNGGSITSAGNGETTNSGSEDPTSPSNTEGGGILTNNPNNNGFTSGGKRSFEEDLFQAADVYDDEVEASGNASFNVGANSIPISASDNAGNMTEFNLIVTYQVRAQAAMVDAVNDIPAGPLGGGGAVAPLVVSVPAGSGITTAVVGGTGETLPVVITEPAPEGLPGAPPDPEDPTRLLELPISVPRGCATATTVRLKNAESGLASDTVNLTEEDIDKQYTALLTDSTGRSYAIGYAFFEEGEISDLKVTRDRTGFQVGNKIVELVTTLRIPDIAASGPAVITITGEKDSLTTFDLEITDIGDVKIGRKVEKRRELPITKLKDPLLAKITNFISSSNLLYLRLKGNNFARKFAIVEGSPDKLSGRNNFHTKIRFLPSDGISAQRIKMSSRHFKSVIKYKAIVNDSTKAGLKIIVVTAPNGCGDIGALILPESDSPQRGKVRTTSIPERFILERFSPDKVNKIEEENLQLDSDDIYSDEINDKWIENFEKDTMGWEDLL